MNRFAGINHKKQRDLFNRVVDNFDHIHLVPPTMYNITPFYKISDLLITEASSTIYEMLALDKPVLVNRFYKLKLSHRLFKKRLYRARLNEEMEREISDFCFEVNQPKELPGVIEDALNNVKSKLSVMEKYKNKMLYGLDGNASLRVRDEILARLE
jgi:CDP-glycerol glycerophosphotransferase (TagB/SpsB family)